MVFACVAQQYQAMEALPSLHSEQMGQAMPIAHVGLVAALTLQNGGYLGKALAGVLAKEVMRRCALSCWPAGCCPGPRVAAAGAVREGRIGVWSRQQRIWDYS